MRGFSDDFFGIVLFKKTFEFVNEAILWIISSSPSFSLKVTATYKMSTYVEKGYTVPRAGS